MPAELSGVHAVLLSGGGGTRLWPVSTETRPKQFLRLFGERSLFQLTLERVSACGIADIHVVTNEAYATDVVAQAEACGIPVSLILEPMRRDSAPAIAAGAAALDAQYGPDAVAVVLPCDHLIPDHAAFGAALRDAVAAARTGSLVTFGISPTSPSTDYGYIRQGEPLAGLHQAFRAAVFKEKPDLSTALSYLASGDYHWNSGMFVFRLGDFAREAQAHMPGTWAAVRDAVRSGERLPHCLRLAAEAFGRAEKISIDYALFEKSANVALLPRQFAWSDVGGWASVHASLPQDEQGNAIGGQAHLHDSRNTLAFGDGIRVIAVGLDDLVVIASPEGVFVAPKSRTGELKTYL